MVLATPAGAAATEHSPLQRHRPVLVFDRDERHFARSLDSPVRPVVYGHLAARGEWLQYWLYFAYNAQDRGVVKTGRHEGDWELLQLRLGAGGQPELGTLSQHSWAEGCEWQALRRRGPAPVVFVANGSHAIYSRPGVHDRPFPDPNDEADGRGRRIRPPVEPIGDGEPAWVERRAPWGDSSASWVPGEQSSPRGPKFQEGGAWSDPQGFHDARARECMAGPPGRPWQTPLLPGLGGLVALGLVMARRRRSIQSRP